MPFQTALGCEMDNELIACYFQSMVGKFFKILPMWETSEPSLPVYIRSLQMELVGCQDFIPDFKQNPQYMTLLSTLEFMADHPETEVADIKREVFKAIATCNRIKSSCGG